MRFLYLSNMRKILLNTFADCSSGLGVYYFGLEGRTLDYDACEQQTHRSACEFTQSDQSLYFALSRKKDS